MRARWDALVAAGGFVGAVLRYLLAVGLGGPVGTFAANVLGSFALGLAVTVVADRRVRLFLATGLLSSFTTYSTFNLELVRYAQEGLVLRALLYGLMTVATCFLAGLAGLAVGRSCSVGRPTPHLRA